MYVQNLVVHLPLVFICWCSSKAEVCDASHAFSFPLCLGLPPRSMWISFSGSLPLGPVLLRRVFVQVLVRVDRPLVCCVVACCLVLAGPPLKSSPRRRSRRGEGQKKALCTPCEPKSTCPRSGKQSTPMPGEQTLSRPKGPSRAHPEKRGRRLEPKWHKGHVCRSNKMEYLTETPYRTNYRHMFSATHHAQRSPGFYTQHVPP